MRRITTFRSTTDRIYGGGPINYIVLCRVLCVLFVVCCVVCCVLCVVLL